MPSGKALAPLAVAAALLGAFFLYAQWHSRREARLQAACGSIRAGMQQGEILRQLGPPKVRLGPGELSRTKVATLWQARPRSENTCWYWYSDPSLVWGGDDNVVEVCFDRKGVVVAASCWHSPLWES